MNDTISQRDSTSDDDAKILDAALLDSDQLLARSLQGEQRRRRRWIALIVIGGVAMSWLLVNFIAAWLAGGQVGDASPTQSSSAVNPFDAKTEKAWEDRLLATKQNDRWDVGAKIGMDLTKLPAGQPLRLLKNNWRRIAANSRKQILKGFTPGMMGNTEMHADFFAVMDLGMRDRDAEVRSFAATYLEMQGLPNYEKDLQAYRAWRKKTELLSADETLKLATDVPKPQLSAKELASAGWKNWQSGNPSAAIEQFEAAVAKDSKMTEAWNGLGWARLNSGQTEEALPAFRECVKLSPRHPGALNGLGQAYFFQGDLKLAERYLKKAAPRAPAAWWGLTKVYLLTGKYQLATKWAEKVAAGSPNEPIATQMLDDARAGKLSDDLRVLIEPPVLADNREVAETAEVN